MKRREFIAGLGSAVAWPLAARAQQQALPVIGYLSGTTENSSRATTTSFHQGLGEWGYVEGRNVEILYRWAEYKYDLLPALAAELVRRRVAVIVTSGGPATHLAAKSATHTIPIVFATGTDPVAFGLVASLNRPGGNVTGVTWLGLQLVAKRLELLHEIAPAVTSIGHLVNPTTPAVGAEMREAESAARVLGVRLVTLNASTPSEIEGAFATLIGQRIGAFLQGADPLFVRQPAQLAALATRYAVPAIYIGRETVEAGGLMSYGASLTDASRLAGTYAGRILKGEKPADLPVQESTKVELVLNLKVAKALGITFPTSLLVRADEVIE